MFRHESTTTAITAKPFGGGYRHEMMTTAKTTAKVGDKDKNVRQQGGIYALAYTPFGGRYYGTFDKN